MSLSNENIIKKNLSFYKILKKINVVRYRILVVLDNRKLVGTITDSDIRKCILLGNQTVNAKKIMNMNPRVIEEKNLLNIDPKKLPKNIKYFPIVDKNFFYKKIYENKIIKKNFFKNILIMAGGKGLRLRPLTKNIPKPMIKINGKPLIHLQLKILENYKTEKIFISVNYLKEKIINYLKGRYPNLYYIVEKKPLGTAGSISKLKIEESSFPLMVINGDILTNFNFNEFYDFHIKHKNDITIGSSIYNANIPFGVMKYDKNFNLKNIQEKPTYQYLCSAGIYSLSFKCFKLIPKNKRFDFNELIKFSLKKKLKVKIFPIYETWNDIGDFEILNQLKKIKIS